VLKDENNHELDVWRGLLGSGCGYMKGISQQLEELRI